jgi:hypothetical protein
MMIRLVGRSIRLGLGMLLRHVLGPFDRATLLNDEQAPFAGHALQAMRAAIGELKPGARDQIPDRTRYQHLVRLRGRSNPGRIFLRVKFVSIHSHGTIRSSAADTIEPRRVDCLAHRSHATLHADGTHNDQWEIFVSAQRPSTRNVHPTEEANQLPFIFPSDEGRPTRRTKLPKPSPILVGSRCQRDFRPTRF